MYIKHHLQAGSQSPCPSRLVRLRLRGQRTWLVWRRPKRKHRGKFLPCMAQGKDLKLGLGLGVGRVPARDGEEGER